MTDKNSNIYPLDDFFRRKAGEYDDISWSEADWLKLESRLETRAQLTASRRRRYLLSAAAVLIISLLSYYTWQNNSQLNELSQLLTPELAEAPVPEDTGGDETPFSEDTGGEEPLIAGEPDSDESNSGEDRTLASGSSDQTDRNSETPTQSNNRENLTDVNPTAGPENTTGESPASNPVAEVPGTSVTDATLAFAPGNAVATREVGNSGSTLLSCPECTFNIVPWRYLSVDYEIPYSEPLASGDVTQPASSGNSGLDNPISANRLSIGINVSPDLSTAGALSNYTSPGFKMGLNVEYRLSRNLSLSAGFIHSTVKYQAGMGDYNPPQGYWRNSALPYSTLAECILIDIPLNLKLDLWQSGRSGFYTSAGLSTYIMLNEEYQFSYTSDQNGRYGEWKNRTGTVHPLSNASFSVGYELNLQQNISIRAEPYIRVPLKEVGWGNVRLYSLGSLFSINYHFF